MSLIWIVNIRPVMTHSVIATLTDQEIVKAILDRDSFVTKEFLYRVCYLWFKSIFDKCYTDCDNSFKYNHEMKYGLSCEQITRNYVKQ